MASSDWKSQLLEDSRQRMVLKMIQTLKQHLPFSEIEGKWELERIAMRFEEKIYNGATSQSDYLRKISLKMLTIESRSQYSMPNVAESRSDDDSENSSDEDSTSQPGSPNGGNQEAGSENDEDCCYTLL